MYEIRKSYRAADVNISYDTLEKTAAYTLAFYPNYALLSYDALVNLRPRLTSELQAISFCSGPAPELLGLAAVLGEGMAAGRHATLDHRSVDLFCDHWSWAAHLSEQLARRFVPSVRTTRSDLQLDLRSRWSDANFDAVTGADVYTFQNCWNEMYCAQSLKNVATIAGSAKPGAFFCFVDQAEYNRNSEALNAVRRELLSLGYSVVHDDAWAFTSSLTAPARVVNEFFDGKPARDEYGNWKGWYLPKSYTVFSLIMWKER